MSLSSKQFNYLLLVLSSLSLTLGFLVDFLGFLSYQPIIWAIGGLIGLIPSIKWIINELRDKQMG